MNILFFLILLPLKLALGAMKLLSFLDDVAVYFWRPTNGRQAPDTYNNTESSIAR